MSSTKELKKSQMSLWTDALKTFKDVLNICKQISYSHILSQCHIWLFSDEKLCAIVSYFHFSETPSFPPMFMLLNLFHFTPASTLFKSIKDSIEVPKSHTTSDRCGGINLFDVIQKVGSNHIILLHKPEKFGSSQCFFTTD
jgi:hypothetical protein